MTARRRRTLRSAEPERAAIWRRAFRLGGFTALPNVVIDKAIPEWDFVLGEIGVIWVLLRHQFDERKPYPRMSTIAHVLGVDTRTVRGWCSRLEQRGFLRRFRRLRPDGTQAANGFDLDSFWEMCERRATKAGAAMKPDLDAQGSDEGADPDVPVSQVDSDGDGDEEADPDVPVSGRPGGSLDPPDPDPWIRPTRIPGSARPGSLDPPSEEDEGEEDEREEDEGEPEGTPPPPVSGEGGKRNQSANEVALAQRLRARRAEPPAGAQPVLPAEAERSALVRQHMPALLAMMSRERRSPESAEEILVVWLIWYVRKYADDDPDLGDRTERRQLAGLIGQRVREWAKGDYARFGMFVRDIFRWWPAAIRKRDQRRDRWPREPVPTLRAVLTSTAFWKGWTSKQFADDIARYGEIEEDGHADGSSELAQREGDPCDADARPRGSRAGRPAP